MTESGPSGIMGEAKFRQVTLLNICLVPGTEGTGKTSTCLFGVAMWQTHCLFYLEVFSFHKIELQLTLYLTNPMCLVHLFESAKEIWRSIVKKGIIIISSQLLFGRFIL